MWADAKDSLRRALRETDGTPQGLTQRDLAAQRYTDRLAQLGAAEYGLCFGRLDFDPEYDRGPANQPVQNGASTAPAEAADTVDRAGAGADPNATLYIGRLGIVDHDFDTLLVDWRAPAARPFYLATAIAPEGVTRRRHIRTRRRKVVSIDDESLVYRPDEPLRTASVTGEATLLAALGAARTGRMSDIVETIQVEQDRIIRAEVNGALVVQGGPGHRQDRRRAAPGGISAVHAPRTAGQPRCAGRRTRTRRSCATSSRCCPALGETAVSLATVGTLFPGVRATSVDADRVATIKGDLAMAKVLAAAVADRQQLPGRGQTVRFEREELPLDRNLVINARRRARSSRQPHNRAGRSSSREMINGLAAAYAGQLGAGIEGGERLLDRHDLADVRDELRADGRVAAAINGLWPRLTPQRLLADLLADDEAMGRAGLTVDQRDLLRRDASAAWTVEDVPLLDELAELLGVDDRAEKERARRRRRRRSPTPRACWTSSRAPARRTSRTTARRRCWSRPT